MEGDQKLKNVKKTVSATADIKGTWARSNVEKPHAFAKHLTNVFQPHPSANEPEEEEVLTHF
jgi:predicted small secreted protein